MENSMEIPDKNKNKIPLWASHLISGVDPKNWKQSLKEIIAPYVHSSTIHISQEMKATQMFIAAEWIRKMWYIHSVEFHSALKRKKTLSCATT